MRRSRSIVGSVGLILLAGLGPGVATRPAAAADLADLSGLWRTERHGALVQVVDCGDGTPCGWLVGVDPTVAQGQTHDVRNRDPARRHRPLVGLPILWGFAVRPEGGREDWRAGRVYNPDDGKTFPARLKMLHSAGLQVTGCLGPLCRSETWTRVVSTPATGKTPSEGAAP